MYAVIGNLNSICEQELTTEPVMGNFGSLVAVTDGDIISCSR